jgi:trk system potassium uptake protein TrkH
MRIHVVMRYVALSLILISVFMFISAGISLYYSDGAFLPFLYSGIILLLFGLFPFIFVPPSTSITNKEGLLIIVLSWLISCLAGSIPYILWGGVFNFTNGWFESVSGFTTTGSSILSDIEILPLSLLFWRAATNWLGGVGIIIFVLAVLPSVGMAEVILFRSEVSEMVQRNFHYRARKAIQIIVGVYVAMTVIESFLLWLFGMSAFDAITHSFATIATGGFSPKNASIAFYNNPVIEIVIIIFMILSGVHFALLFSIIKGNTNLLWKSTILRFYIIVLFSGILFSTLDLSFNQDINFLQALRLASFNIVSVGTSTGFATTDTTSWPSLCKLLIIFFTLQCACSGSTSGGIKVDRVILVIKSFIKQIRLIMHPNAVIRLRIDSKVIDQEIVSKSVLYVMIYLIIVFLSTMVLSIMGVDLIDSFTGTIATMGNVGPGLGTVGSTGNFSQIPDAGKWLLSVVMLLGRLEIYALFIIITPAQWKDTVSY